MGTEEKSSAPMATKSGVFRTVALEWFMRAVLNRGMDPHTFEPNLASAVEEDYEDDD